MPIKVTHHDNRGDEEAPYGYVYFDDGTRLAYAPHTSGMGNPLGLFPGGWGAVRSEHYSLANDYLTEKGLS
jgi:hypothetical protein